MSGPRSRSAWLDFVAASRTCSGSRLPTLGISRSMMYFFMTSSMGTSNRTTCCSSCSRVDVKWGCDKVADMPLYMGDQAILDSAIRDANDRCHRFVSRRNFLLDGHRTDGGVPSCRRAVERPDGEASGSLLSSNDSVGGGPSRPV